MTGTTSKITSAMEKVLCVVERRTSTHSGRGGWSASLMRAMERRGLVRMGEVGTWETTWHFTEAGIAEGRRVVAARRAPK